MREQRRSDDADQPGRERGPWPYGSAGPGYLPPAYEGFPGYPTYPWSRFSHGMDAFYEDWQGPGFGTHGPAGVDARTEVFDRKGKTVIRVELPGVDPKDVNVSAERGALIIEGSCREESEDRRCARTFFSSVPIPERLSPSDIHARFRNGVLEITVPRTERPSERIPIRIET